MRLTPQTEKQAAEAALLATGLFPRGDYPFEIVKATDTHSKAGNEMIELQVRVFDKNDRSRVIRDWLLEGEFTSFKVRHFAEAIGMLPQYEKGELKAEDLEGKTGTCKVRIKKDKKGLYPDQNSISDYINPTAAKKLVQSVADPALDDEIPF